MLDCCVHSFLIQGDIKSVPLVDILQKHSVNCYKKCHTCRQRYVFTFSIFNVYDQISFHPSFHFSKPVYIRDVFILRFTGDKLVRND